MKRNRWRKKKKLQGRSDDTAFGLANIADVMWGASRAGGGCAGSSEVFAVAASGFSPLSSRAFTPVTC